MEEETKARKKVTDSYSHCLEFGDKSKPGLLPVVSLLPLFNPPVPK